MITLTAIKDSAETKFRRDQKKLTQILGKGVNILHPEVIQHLLATAFESLSYQD